MTTIQHTTNSDTKPRRSTKYVRDNFITDEALAWSAVKRRVMGLDPICGGVGIHLGQNKAREVYGDVNVRKLRNNINKALDEKTIRICAAHQIGHHTRRYEPIGDMTWRFGRFELKKSDDRVEVKPWTQQCSPFWTVNISRTDEAFEVPLKDIVHYRDRNGKGRLVNSVACNTKVQDWRICGEVIDNISLDVVACHPTLYMKELLKWDAVCINVMSDMMEEDPILKDAARRWVASGGRHTMQELASGMARDGKTTISYDKALSRLELLQEVWGPNEMGDDAYRIMAGLEAELMIEVGRALSREALPFLDVYDCINVPLCHAQSALTVMSKVLGPCFRLHGLSCLATEEPRGARSTSISSPVSHQSVSDSVPWSGALWSVGCEEELQLLLDEMATGPPDTRKQPN